MTTTKAGIEAQDLVDQLGCMGCARLASLSSHLCLFITRACGQVSLISQVSSAVQILAALVACTLNGASGSAVGPDLTSDQDSPDSRVDRNSWLEMGNCDPFPIEQSACGVTLMRAYFLHDLDGSHAVEGE